MLLDGREHLLEETLDEVEHPLTGTIIAIAVVTVAY